MPMFRLLDEKNYARKVQDDPSGWHRFFRKGSFSYFNKPEGEGCLEKFAAVNYQTFWIQTPIITVFQLGFHKVKSPMGFFYRYGKAAWPLHAFASIAAVTSCGMCSYRGKDDHWNWMTAGALAGTVPGLAARSLLLRENRYGTKLWVFTLPLGMFWFSIFAGLIKISNPRIVPFDMESMLSDDKHQYQPEKFIRSNPESIQSYTMPGERWSIDCFIGGFGKELPWSWIGEKFEHRQMLIKQQYGYLEGELDQVPAIEKAIRERR